MRDSDNMKTQKGFDITQLQSIRTFKQQEIPNKVLQQIFEAGRHTPTAHNVQPWQFIIVTDPIIKKELAANAKFVEDAAIVIVGCGDPSESPRWYQLEVAMALQSMVVTAWINGIGACWIDVRPNEAKVREILKIPNQYPIIASVALGYPAAIPELAWKRPIDEVFHYNQF
jgi:nitroreductase